MVVVVVVVVAAAFRAIYHGISSDLTEKEWRDVLRGLVRFFVFGVVFKSFSRCQLSWNVLDVEKQIYRIWEQSTVIFWFLFITLLPNNHAFPPGTKRTAFFFEAAGLAVSFSDCMVRQRRNPDFPYPLFGSTPNLPNSWSMA